jgi:Ankyrin repeats (many copies)
MTTNDSGQDEELLERYRNARDGQPVSPSEAARAAILAEGRRAADARAKKLRGQSFDAARPAANDSRWKIAAFGTAGAALFAALLFAPRFWGNSHPPQPSRAESSSATDSKPPGAAPTQLSSSAQAVAQSDADAKKLSPRRFVAEASQFAANVPATPNARAVQNAQAAQNAPAALRSAAASGDTAKTTALLDQGASLDGRDEHGRTPLMLAVMLNRLDVVRVLLDRGADPNIADDTGRTPLQHAKQKNLPGMAGLLESAGAR